MRSRWILVPLLAVAFTLLHAGTDAVHESRVCAATVECAKTAASIAKQFGPEFKPALEYPPLFGDLDGDGQEDAVVVATGSALGGQQEFDYKVVDPYNAYFGWGDPKVTVTFEQMQPGPKRNILVVHDWKAKEPKAKFVIINLPFEKLSLARAMVKKKTVWAISAEESSTMISLTYWDGKRYRWRASSMGE
jgi:ABC-type transport system substrate-binding protein